MSRIDFIRHYVLVYFDLDWDLSQLHNISLISNGRYLKRLPVGTPFWYSCYLPYPAKTWI